MNETTLLFSPEKSSYDDIPYTSQAYPQTHPDRLATLARLFGLTPAPITRCRVLELGCAEGGNLLPMAFHLPESEFVGIDLSHRQVTTANETIDSLNLKNARAENASIMAIDPTWGRFDYIICHGVYSWVSEEVQDKILAVAAANLKPRGVAYVSYNTYPGWHLREMVRNMMHYHVAQFEDTTQRIAQARALIDFLAASVSTEGYYGQMLKSELELVRRVNDAYLFHEHLEQINMPVYFHRFIARAATKGLQYLGEADFSTMLSSGFSSEVAETLDRISPGIIRTEQYMDFLRNRFFRQTLLCHQALAINRNLEAQRVEGFLIASSATPETDSAGLSAGNKLSFRTPSGKTFSTDFPLTKSALCVLHDHWPRAVESNRLRQAAYGRLGQRDPADRAPQAWKTVLGDLLHCYTLDIVEFHTWQAPFSLAIDARPNVSRLAVHQLNRGQTVVNQRHERVNLDAMGRELMRTLDGRQDRPALLEHLEQCVAAGTLVVQQDGQPLTDQQLIARALEEALDQTLKKLAGAALLVG